MSEILELIKNNFSNSIQTKINSADTLLPMTGNAAEKIVRCLLDGHKVLTCGTGSSAFDALHFASQMINRLHYERPSLPAIALNSDASTLTTFSNDLNANDLFAKQIRALGQSGDILLAISSNLHSANLLNAIKAAHDRRIHVVALTGADGGKVAQLLTEEDVEIRIPTNDPARIQETHLLIIHCLCDIIDFQLFGNGEIHS